MVGRDILLYMKLHRAKKNYFSEKFSCNFFCFCFNGTANNFIFTAVAQGFQNCAWIWHWTMGSGLRNWTDKRIYVDLNIDCIFCEAYYYGQIFLWYTDFRTNFSYFALQVPESFIFLTRHSYKYTDKSITLHTISVLWSKTAIFRGAWHNVNMQPLPWAPTALIPHIRAFKRGILLCCISRGSKVTSKSANEKSDLHHFT